jgi:gluconolactonase
MLRALFSALAVVLLLAASVAGFQQAAPLEGIPGVVAKGAVVELVKEGFVFTEGPVGTADGGLFFSDLQSADRTYRLDPAGAITVFREQTNGANGLAINKSGDLFSADGTGKRISRVGADKRVTILTEGSPERPLLAPNDLTLDAKGGIYFTDPGPRPVVPGRKVHVYYLPAGAKLPMMLDDQITRPNGIVLTRDAKTLLVDDTVGDIVYAYDVQPDGTVRNKRTFAKLQNLPAGQDSGADGMALDRDDRLYVTSVNGIQVFDKTGRYLGVIPVPRQPSNAAFSGPDRRTLYITAREGLYRLRMLSQGPDRPGK